MMNLAFNTNLCANGDVASIAVAVHAAGYSGVEIAAAASAGAQSSPGAETLAPVLLDAGLTLVCLDATARTPPITPSHHSHLQADYLRQLDLAARLSIGIMKIRAAWHTRSIRDDGLARLRPLLSKLADQAAHRHVKIAIENAPPFQHARQLWQLLESIDHPSLAVSWDIACAAAAGESPYISVPMLGTKIALASLAGQNIQAALDATAGGIEPHDVSAPIASLMLRLRGIGFAGWTVIGWRGTTPPADPVAYLSTAAAKLSPFISKPEPAKKLASSRK